MRSGAKNTLKKRGSRLPTARRAAFATTGARPARRRRSPELARRPAGQRGRKTAGFTIIFTVIFTINFTVIFYHQVLLTVELTVKPLSIWVSIPVSIWVSSRIDTGIDGEKECFFRCPITTKKMRLMDNLPAP